MCIRDSLRVPQNYHDKYGALGKVVDNIRGRRDYVDGHPDRLAWLRARGFRMHATDATEDARRWDDADVRCVVEGMVQQVAGCACYM